MRNLVVELDPSPSSTEHVADRLALVLGGVYASVAAPTAAGPAAQARPLVETLLDAAQQSAAANP